ARPGPHPEYFEKARMKKAPEITPGPFFRSAFRGLRAARFAQRLARVREVRTRRRGAGRAAVCAEGRFCAARLTITLFAFHEGLAIAVVAFAERLTVAVVALAEGLAVTVFALAPGLAVAVGAVA